MNFYYQMDRFVISAAKKCDRSGKKILDIGVQASNYKRLFSKAQYFSHDLKQNKEQNLDITGNLNKGLPFVKDKTFDYIFCIQVLEHLKRPRKVFREFYRILKPGGLLFLTTNFLYQIHSAPNDYFRFTEYGIKYLGKSSGFIVRHLKPQNGVFQTLSYLATTLPTKLFTKKESLAYWSYIILFSPLIIFMNLTATFLDKIFPTKEVTVNYEAIFQKPNYSKILKGK